MSNSADHDSDSLPLLEFILRNYHNFNSRALRDALLAYWRHIESGGKMFWAIAGAMSTAQLGITLSPAIRAGLIHGVSITGANLEESLFRLVAHNSFKDFPDYRYFSKDDDKQILAKRMRRVTDTSIPEDEAFRYVERLIMPMWKAAHNTGQRYYWHEYFYELIQQIEPDQCRGIPEDCWLLAAANHKLPMIVPGYEDSTFGNIFASYVRQGQFSASIARSGIEYMVNFYDQYQDMAKSGGVGFFQVGGGIAGDFPICVVPSLKYDLGEQVNPWTYFCQVSDSTTSYGSYSGATPNEKITWDKLDRDTPMFVIESDATIVVPLMLNALLECQRKPKIARTLIDALSL